MDTMIDAREYFNWCEMLDAIQQDNIPYVQTVPVNINGRSETLYIAQYTHEFYLGLSSCSGSPVYYADVTDTHLVAILDWRQSVIEITEKSGTCIMSIAATICNGSGDPTNIDKTMTFTEDSDRLFFHTWNLTSRRLFPPVAASGHDETPGVTIEDSTPYIRAIHMRFTRLFDTLYIARLRNQYYLALQNPYSSWPVYYTAVKDIDGLSTLGSSRIMIKGEEQAYKMTITPPGGEVSTLIFTDDSKGIFSDIWAFNSHGLFQPAEADF